MSHILFLPTHLFLPFIFYIKLCIKGPLPDFFVPFKIFFKNWEDEYLTYKLHVCYILASENGAPGGNQNMIKNMTWSLCWALDSTYTAYFNLIWRWHEWSNSNWTFMSFLSLTSSENDTIRGNHKCAFHKSSK